MSLNRFCVILFLTLGVVGPAVAQENVIPLQDNAQVGRRGTYPKQKYRASLPFLDDFSYKASVPNPLLWEEAQVFINNTMGVNVPTQGVATFDGLDETGRPYRPNDFGAVGYGDSLTCTPIDLSLRTPSDSIVLSFWVQAQGNGFAPETKDSLFLFFRNNNNDWIPVWQRRGTGVHPFLQFFVSVNETQYMHDSFQFRFVNFTSLNLNDDVWNLDYVKLDVNRSHVDTTLNDLAFTDQPTSILSTYTAMPFRHFLATDLSSQQDIYVRNSYDVSNTFTVRHSANEVIGTSNLSTNSLVPFNAFAKSVATVSNPSYSLGLSGNGPFTVRNTYSLDALNPSDFKGNDTIITDVVFDNYFAYDDGSAEQAYFLNAALNQPAKTAMRFELRQADSVYGLSVYFAPQVPSAAGKFFSIVLYDSLGSTSAADVVLYQQDLYKVQYPTKRGELSSYAFDTPIGLGPGTYYIGISQPANFGSDSIYYGLDVNTDNNLQQLSYNVNTFWFNSSVTGTVMMRPMVGGSFVPTSTDEFKKVSNTILYPNPSMGIVYIASDTDWKQYEILNLNGQILKSTVLQNSEVHLGDFPSGNYFIRLINNKDSEIHRIWKQ